METINYKKGDAVMLSTREGKMMKGLFSHIAPNGKAYIKAEDGKSYERELKSIRKIGEAATMFEAAIPETLTPTPTLPISTDPWDINTKFDFLARLVRMVIDGTSVSLVVTGEGGLGKSYTVKRQLELKRLVKSEDYVIIKGFSTPKGLYKTLYENNGKLIIFDDCDEVLEDKIAKNLLKGALDSYDTREIHWISAAFFGGDDLPTSFEFTGRIIFISNMSKNKVDQAILSRSMNIDLTLSREDIINRMKFIIDTSKSFMPTYPMEWKYESLEIIKENMGFVRELSLRSLEKIVKIRAGEKADELSYYEEDAEAAAVPEIDWRDLAKFMLLS